jgi:hypothetical protein
MVFNFQALAELRLEGGIEAAEGSKEESAAAKKRREKRERQKQKATEIAAQPPQEKESTPAPGNFILRLIKLYK